MATDPNRINPTPVRLNTQFAEERQTPKTDFGSKLRDGVETTAHVAGVVASALPGGAILSAAVSAGSSLTGQTTASASGNGIVGTPRAAGGTTNASPASSGQLIPSGDSAYDQAVSLLNAQEVTNMRYLALQERMQEENRYFSTMSNVMKTRHDTAKNTIANTH
jgi:hypothetical protein